MVERQLLITAQKVKVSGNAEMALLSQEGSMIETKSRSCGGWFPKLHTDKWFLWNLPPRDPLRDPAALLTEEGHSTTLS
jgi:hypothetical protein